MRLLSTTETTGVDLLLGFRVAQPVEMGNAPLLRKACSGVLKPIIVLFWRLLIIIIV